MNAHNEQSSVVEKVAAEMREFYDAEMAPDDDVLKSWIDRLAAQPSPVVKFCLTTQPAAAQEAVYEISHVSPMNFGGFCAQIITSTKLERGTKLYAAPVTASPVGDLFVECRQCEECNHAGINDSGDNLAACLTCYWSGMAPDEDRCPECGKTGCMSAACPKCGARYKLVASAEFPASTPAAPGIDMGVPGATLTIDGETFTVDEVRAALLIDASPKGGIDLSWSLHDRVEFALRDAGFDLDEAAFVAEAASVANGDLDSPKGGSGCRYFCGGPEGHFFCNDLKLARDLVNAYDKADEWTITDLQAGNAKVQP